MLTRKYAGYGVSNSLLWNDLDDNAASYIVVIMLVGYFCPLTIIMYCYRSIYNLVQVTLLLFVMQVPVTLLLFVMQVPVTLLLFVMQVPVTLLLFVMQVPVTLLLLL